MKNNAISSEKLNILSLSISKNEKQFWQVSRRYVNSSNLLKTTEIQFTVEIELVVSRW